jgi:AcrR family transcriptional regulator
MAKTKSEETSFKILEAALELFRTEGYDKTTMRDIAASAGVATGAAYYYFESKDAIVQAFYAMASTAMQPRIEAALASEKGFEKKLRAILQTKMDYFQPFRSVLRALLRNGADPSHPLSPFSEQTKEIRDTDIVWFTRIVTDGGIAVPRDLSPHLPAVLWLYQMGVIFFWVTDESENQARTAKLVDLSTKAVTQLVKLSALPLTRPIRKAAIDLIETVRS